MNLVTALLLFVTFPYWFPLVVLFYIVIGGLWVIGYPVLYVVRMSAAFMTKTLKKKTT